MNYVNYGSSDDDKNKSKDAVPDIEEDDAGNALDKKPVTLDSSGTKADLFDGADQDEGPRKALPTSP